MVEYIKSMRGMIGNSPLLMCGASVMIFNSSNQVLMLRRVDNGQWCFPGGAMELGESAVETARREVLEETGITLDQLILFDVFSGKELRYIYPNGDEVFNVDVVYSCHIDQEEIQLSNESREYHFYDIASIPSEISPPVLPIVAELKRRHQEPIELHQ